MFASLPMYDFPEHREHADALWASVAAGLRARGIAAPWGLTRPGELPEDWLKPDLLLSQTCGLPFVRHLRGRVALVGAADHGLSDCAPGFYRSHVVVRVDEPAQGLAQLRHRVAAINSEESQSGAGALRTAVGVFEMDGPFFSRVVTTGAHAESVRAVAEGRADVAAIDAVTWAMLLRYRPETRSLRVIHSTPETPGLPFITNRDGPAVALFEALAEGIQAIGDKAREALMIHGVVERLEAHFDGIAAADVQAKPLDPS